MYVCDVYVGGLTECTYRDQRTTSKVAPHLLPCSRQMSLSLTAAYTTLAGHEFQGNSPNFVFILTLEAFELQLHNTMSDYTWFLEI